MRSRTPFFRHRRTSKNGFLFSCMFLTQLGGSQRSAIRNCEYFGPKPFLQTGVCTGQVQLNFDPKVLQLGVLRQGVARVRRVVLLENFKVIEGIS